jgi:short-subunit dehydrogenase
MNNLSKPARWAVITGASDGIGRAFAVELAARNWGCVLVARRGDMLEALADELGADRCLILPLDLADAGATYLLAHATAELPVELLVAAAGFGTSGPLADTSLEDELTMIDVNCRAVAAQVHLFAGRMAAQGRGGIILFSSIVAFQGVPRSANYAATKAYIQTLAEGLRPELKPYGVDVLSVAPGPIASGFAARAGLTMGMSQTPDVVAKAALAALGKTTTVKPGWLAKLLITSLGFLPRWGRTLVVGQIMAGMTKGKASG